MGSLRVTVCTSALVAAVLTPAAYAADGGGVSVTPATPAPGSDVTLRVTGCAERTAVARSAAFVADARLTVADGDLVGESRVRSTLDAGTYVVQVRCGDAERAGTFTVREGEGRRRSASGTDEPSPPLSDLAGTGGQPPAPGTVGQPPVPEGGGQSSAPGENGDGEGDGQQSTPGEDQQQSAPRRPGAHPSPVAPVRAGGGGAADLVAAEDRGAGPGTAQGVTGLVLAGVAAVVVALGGVRRSRGTD
ncbi:hypothetical protein [Streptomyces sp. NPDC050416]|uniref:hypothetical protein n=1 Tax=Streptomyces sp. NPDC050416 TaxID=3365611 RepID=UPI00379776E2